MSTLVLHSEKHWKESDLRSLVVEAAKPYLSRFLGWGRPKSVFPLPGGATIVLTKNTFTLKKPGWSDYEIDQTNNGWVFLIDQKVIVKVANSPWRLIPLFVNAVKYDLSPEGISSSVSNLSFQATMKEVIPCTETYFKELWFEKAGFSQSRFDRTAPRLRKKILKRLGYM